MCNRLRAKNQRVPKITTHIPEAHQKIFHTHQTSEPLENASSAEFILALQESRMVFQRSIYPCLKK